jgi:fatty acid desaturase
MALTNRPGDGHGRVLGWAISAAFAAFVLALFYVLGWAWEGADGVLPTALFVLLVLVEVALLTFLRAKSPLRAEEMRDEKDQRKT